MKKIFLFLILSSGLLCSGQTTQKFNLDFEKKQENSFLPKGWIKWGTYLLETDTLNVHSGKKSLKITQGDNGNRFGSAAYKIPANYTGRTITLEGYMKLKNVENGFAGLLLRIDGNEGALAFDNMDKKNISGTRDWEKYSISLNYPEGAETIYVGGILSGNGEVWLDNFELRLDGKNIQTLKEIEKEFTEAQLDTVFDQGSNLKIPKLTPKKINDLELLGKVWGFLKYYHPAISQGDYNWDYELFRFLPDYIANKNKKERNTLLINWIDSLGPLPACTNCKPTDENAIIKPDFGWIKKLNQRLRKKLFSVYKNRSQGKHFYISAASTGNPKFKNENDYKNMPYPDVGFRLLALYRYWNMINYFFPYKDLTDNDWRRVLKEYIPEFIQAGNELEYELASVKLIAEVRDTHANLWGGGDEIAHWKGNCFPPVYTQFIENKLVVTDYYNDEHKDETGLKIGDIITHINGESIQEIVERKSGYYPASNVPTRLRNISRDLLRSNATEIEIRIISGKASEETKKLKLYPRGDLNMKAWYKKDDGKSFKLLENNIGYVSLGTIKDKDIPQIKEKFKDTRGIIIDIRNYPSTFVPFSLGSFFVSQKTPFVKFTTVNLNNPGEFQFINPIEIPSTGNTYKGQLIVLVNERTQSQAEYTAMAFRAGDNTKIIGSTTAGADGNVSEILLPGGLRTMISGIGVFYPDGGETQRIGIVPDVEVKPTIKGIRENKDELLDKAIEIIIEE
ncbi:C-terminal processing protease CtpA/Prc, contains a PDZ domain [Salegentibacter echinorum]|uniref:C-terminal processing protease CtpA/Prc, contains a PDZ domain n=1 Tax=Salegentibacter echinorum TaxID=1073325 RepID=A0A1M5DR32_SALEC|nr:S41 family peptidase [Salegentibacter echinorum]SHF69488.1 C-terminal processing protease CtpA/Prc, contains a PDZ domain [Salegentibacter echinorum]